MTYEEALDILLFNKLENDKKVKEAYDLISNLIDRHNELNKILSLNDLRFEIIRKFGTIDYFASIIGTNTAYLRRYLNGYSNVSDKMKKRIYSVLEKGEIK